MKLFPPNTDKWMYTIYVHYSILTTFTNASRDATAFQNTLSGMVQEWCGATTVPDKTVHSDAHIPESWRHSAPISHSAPHHTSGGEGRQPRIRIIKVNVNIYVLYSEKYLRLTYM